MSTPTLDQLWKTLGFDSLPADAGSTEDLGSTRVPDWEEATVRHEEVPAPAVNTERIDLPRISLTRVRRADACSAQRYAWCENADLSS